MNSLRSRIRPEGHAVLKGAMYVTCTNKSVMKMNNTRLSELSTELIEVEARNRIYDLRLMRKVQLEEQRLFKL